MKALTRYGWIGAILFGIALAGGGAFMIQEGRAAHDEVQNTLASEKIVTPEDAGIPTAPVTGPEEAKAQAEVIREHVLKITNGKTYAELDKNDPNRNTYLTSVTLRTALMESYLAFKVSDLVTGMGVIVVFLGLSHVVLGAYLGFVVLPQLKAVAV